MQFKQLSPINQLNNILYILLSFISSLLELGSVLVLLHDSKQVSVLIIGALAYQLGNLLVSSVHIKSRLQIAFLVIAITLYFWPSKLPIQFYISILLASSALQAFRRDLTRTNEVNITTFNKRLVRIAGFLASGFVTYKVLGFTILVILAIALLKNSHEMGNLFVNTSFKFKRKNILSLLMVIHQSHYFSYAYLLIILLVNELNVPQILIGPFFIIGWISYTLSEKIFNRFNLFFAFIAGHILVTISLIFMGHFHHTLYNVLIAWFVSGLGGGTVFCLTRLNRKTIETYQVDIEIWEDVGHVIGTLVPIVLAAFFFNNYSYFFFSSAAIAFATAMMMYFSQEDISRITKGA